MKISELINELKEIMDKQGDLEVLAVSSECHGCKSGPVYAPEVINDKVYIDGAYS